MLHKTFQVLWLIFFLLVSTYGCGPVVEEKAPERPTSFPEAPPISTEARSEHPHLWMRPEDLPRLRSLVTNSNPYYRDGLAVLVEAAKQNMDAGRVPNEDSGSAAWEEYPTEEYAMLFAFMSLVHPEYSEREAFAGRAHRLLMYVMDQAVKGMAEGKPFRDTSFSWNDRSRWYGRSWGLTVDWIYPYLSSEDKATIREVFLRWCEEIRTQGRYHPEPIGTFNDPKMLADPGIYRWSANNYFAAGMRNMGTMALAFDPADDPDNQLHGYLKDAIGARLYLFDYMLRTDARGGLLPEGFQYSPQALGYAAEFLLTLHTAGEADADKWGSQVISLSDNPFWDDSIPAFLHSLSPAQTRYSGDLSYVGEVYQPAWYGDAEKYWAPDMIEVYGPLGLYDQLAGNNQRLTSVRWIETYIPVGGKEGLIAQRMANAETFGSAILYFLLFDPASEEPADPRSTLPLEFFAEGTGRLLVRSSWQADATWFNYALSWNSIDHQQMDGNSFELYRNGEWLIKRRVGYGFDYALSDNHNTLAIQNDKPERPRDDYRMLIWERGSQWPYNDALPQILARSVQDQYVYLMGDATPLYNSSYEGLSSVTQAVRSIVWVRGSGGSHDILVIHDRASTSKPEQFKRFWLGLPAEMKMAGESGVMVTDSGQQLFLQTLLPLDAKIDVRRAMDEPSGHPASGENVQYKLVIEPSAPATHVIFLTVLQAVDEGSNAFPVSLIESQPAGIFIGAKVGKTAVLFPLEQADFGELQYEIPAETRWQLITGLEPNSAYDVLVEPLGERVRITVRAGSQYQSDAGGALRLTIDD